MQIGLNVPYDFGNNMMSGDEVLDGCVKLGISAVELRSQPVELFMGVPAALLAPQRGAARNDQGGAATTASEDLSKWRASAPLSKAKDFRKKYEDAGVLIQILKFDNILRFSDQVLDYAFELAKTLGAGVISCELPVDQVEGARRLGAFAERHKIWMGFHGHTAMTPAIWEQAFTYSKYNGANLDIGHFVGGNKTSPVPFLKQHHDRITHVHVKDKTLQDANVPFGTGDTPIKEVLQLIRDNKWNVQATIEFEYPVPQGSDRMTEIAKCIQYCRTFARWRSLRRDSRRRLLSACWPIVTGLAMRWCARSQPGRSGATPTPMPRPYFTSAATLEGARGVSARARARVRRAAADAGAHAAAPRGLRRDRSTTTTRVSKVYFESLPGFLVTGNLYRPSGDGPFPAVLSPHGHWTYGRLENTPIDSGPGRAINLARQGFVVFTYDMVGYNDSRQLPHTFGGPREKLWGLSLGGLQLWNSIRSLDFLETLPYVRRDAHRRDRRIGRRHADVPPRGGRPARRGRGAGQHDLARTCRAAASARTRRGCGSTPTTSRSPRRSRRGRC